MQHNAMHLNAHERGVQPGERVMQDTDLKLRSDRLKLVTGCIDNYQGRQREGERGTKANVAGALCWCFRAASPPLDLH